MRFNSKVTKGFSFSPLRDSCSPLRGSLTALSGTRVGSIKRTKGFPMTTTLMQQNGKHKIPNKRTNRRSSTSTLLTDLELSCYETIFNPCEVKQKTAFYTRGLRWHCSKFNNILRFVYVFVPFLSLPNQVFLFMKQPESRRTTHNGNLANNEMRMKTSL